MAKLSLSQQIDQLVEAMLAHPNSELPPADERISALLRVATQLCLLPRPDFKARLKSDLERRALMATTAKTAPAASKVKPIPEGHHSVSPLLCVKGAASAIEFYKRAFGATEVTRLSMPGGKIGHAEIQVGDSRIMLSDEFPEYGNRSPESIGGSPVIVHLYVEDVDALAARVSAAGIKVDVADQDYGDRAGRFTDPFGHKWHISTHRVDMTFEAYLKLYGPGGQKGTGSGEELLQELAKTAKPIPEGFHTATPHLTVADGAKAIEFYKKAFGAVENESMRFSDPDGRIAHAEIRIGDSPIMLAGEAPDYGRRSPEALGGSPVIISLYVEDVDAVARQAVEAGAKVLIPVADQFYGDRAGRFADPFGHVWIISTHIEDVSPQEIEKRTEAFMKQQAAQRAQKEATPGKPTREGFHTVTPYLTSPQAPELLEFVKQAFGAKELYRGTGGGGGMHAEVRIGDSTIMIGGGGAWRGTPMVTGLHLYVPDIDAVHKRAVELGATVLHEPMDQSYGERSSAVKDLAGNFWYIATHSGPTYIPEGLRDVNVYLLPNSASKLIGFLEDAFGAKEIARYQTPDGRIMHAAVRIGDSVVEMGEPHGQYPPMPTMFYLYVEDVDALYKRAVGVGAISMSAPADQPYGDRVASVKDLHDNVWYMATPVRR